MKESRKESEYLLEAFNISKIKKIINCLKINIFTNGEKAKLVFLIIEIQIDNKSKRFRSFICACNTAADQAKSRF